MRGGVGLLGPELKRSKTVPFRSPLFDMVTWADLLSMAGENVQSISSSSCFLAKRLRFSSRKRCASAERRKYAGSEFFWLMFSAVLLISGRNVQLSNSNSVFTWLRISCTYCRLAERRSKTATLLGDWGSSALPLRCVDTAGANVYSFSSCFRNSSCLTFSPRRCSVAFW